LQAYNHQVKPTLLPLAIILTHWWWRGLPKTLYAVGIKEQMVTEPEVSVRFSAQKSVVVLRV